MKEKRNIADKVLSVIFRNPFAMHTITLIANNLQKTRQGIWKTVHELVKEELLRSEQLQKSRTSTAIIKLNWESPIVSRTISLLLIKESLRQSRWRTTFAELERHVEFLILFGSILHSQKEANDIDMLAVVQKKNFKIVEEIILKIQKTQLKKIHLIDMTEEEFNREIKKPNDAYLEAVRKGTVLYGQEVFVQYIRGLNV